jgi:hypothetical protein
VCRKRGINRCTDEGWLLGLGGYLSLSLVFRRLRLFCTLVLVSVVDPGLSFRMNDKLGLI